MFLNEILSYKKEEVRAKRSARGLSELKSRIEDLPATIPFGPAISKGDTVSLIAEVKKASPSKGIIREDFDPVKIARIYEESLASAISVLTDKAFFQGDLEYLALIRDAVKIPLLRKDFIIDEFQIYEARAYGADALLLIAAILEKTQLAEYQHLAYELGLDSLIEVHTEKEVEKVLGSAPKIIGINNRDLSTFDTDINTTRRLIKLIPDDKIVVSESGISTRDDMLALKDQGVDAVLIGETLMKSDDIGKKIRELLGR
ncbi:MAG TPA: indole-3-glycerol phosphate synthase TrpC [Nitrospiria bacterium]|nr:indole-3-glycerol phosphate synthase TrpC [Nitrospiria bacterium]